MDASVVISVRPVKLSGYTTEPLISGLRSMIELSKCATCDKLDKSTHVPCKDMTCAYVCESV